ncbi:Uncharacterised protein [Mycobacteroides abscessus subsp. abscessus]|nr:Uncharacterised protein [Mycobacteroides abscessus subsp. abscessus]
MSCGGLIVATIKVGCRSPSPTLLRVSASIRVGTPSEAAARRNLSYSEARETRSTTASPTVTSGIPTINATGQGL